MIHHLPVEWSAPWTGLSSSGMTQARDLAPCHARRQIERVSRVTRFTLTALGPYAGRTDHREGLGGRGVGASRILARSLGCVQRIDLTSCWAHSSRMRIGSCNNVSTCAGCLLPPRMARPSSRTRSATEDVRHGHT
jgi:hypothetical protein